MSNRVKAFREERQKLNELLLEGDNLNLKRFFGLDSAVFLDGALNAKTKELLGLVASIVLRCDDCISYHTIAAKEHGTTDEEFGEVMNIGLIAGGSITIPHLRRANRLWKELNES